MQMHSIYTFIYIYIYIKYCSISKFSEISKLLDLSLQERRQNKYEDI